MYDLNMFFEDVFHSIRKEYRDQKLSLVDTLLHLITLIEEIRDCLNDPEVESYFNCDLASLTLTEINDMITEIRQTAKDLSIIGKMYKAVSDN